MAAPVPVNQTEALRIAAEIIDAQARYIHALERGRWKERDDREEIEEKLPAFRKYMHGEER